MRVKRLVPEHEINVEHLRQILESYAIDCDEVDDEDEVLVSDESCNLSFFVDKERKLIVLRTAFELDIEPTKAVEYANFCNKQYILVQFAFNKDHLTASYAVTFVGGLNIPAFIKQLRKFAAICKTAIMAHKYPLNNYEGESTSPNKLH